MTVIAGVEHKGSVIIGGDSAVTNDDYGQILSTTPKVWGYGANDEWVFGSCGSVRLGLLLMHNLAPPTPPDDPEGLERFLTIEFTDAVRAILLESGTVHSKNGIEDMVWSSHFLFGVRGQLWMMQEDFGVVRCARGYFTAGSGAYVAMGSLHATDALPLGKRPTPRRRVELALEAACDFNASCAPPLEIVEGGAE